MVSDEEIIERAVRNALLKQSTEALKFKYYVCGDADKTTIGGVEYFFFEGIKGKRLEYYILVGNPCSVYLVPNKNTLPVGMSAPSTTEMEAYDLRGGTWFPQIGYKFFRILNIDPVSGDATNLEYKHNGLASRGNELTEDECLLAAVIDATSMVIRYRDYPE